jgi:hypothetical protein
MQPLLSHTAAADILKEPRRAVVIRMAKDHVGDELLKTGVLLHFASGTIAEILAFQQRRQIGRQIGSEPLKMSQRVKLAGRQHQHALLGNS